MMFDELDDDFALAKIGETKWEEYISICGIDDSVGVVFFPGHDEELELMAIKGLEEYQKNKYLSKMVCFTINDNYVFPTNVQSICLSSEEINAMLKYYRLVQPARLVIVISYDVPYGNGSIDNLLKGKGISKKDYVEMALMVRE